MNNVKDQIKKIKNIDDLTNHLLDFTYSITNGRINLSKDFVQDALLNLYLKYPDFEDILKNEKQLKESIVDQLKGTIVNQWKMHCRSRSKEKITNEFPWNVNRDDKRTEAKIDLDNISTQLKHNKGGNVFYLHIFKDQKLKDIAKQQNLPLNTVKTRLSRTKKALRCSAF